MGGILTATELELMNIVWNLKEASVKDVLAKLTPDRDLAYTSVSTILRILEKKGVLTTRKMGRTHVYVPAITRREYGEKTVEHVVTNVFAQAPSALAKTLLNHKNLTAEDLLELRKLIDERMNHDV